MMSNGPSDAVEPLAHSGRTRTVALLLVLLALLFVWWKQGTPIPWLQGFTAPRYVAPPQPHLRTEEEWLVGQIGRRIAETAGFAKAGRGPEVLGLKVRVTHERAEHYRFETAMGETELPATELDLSNYLWDPNNFTSLARQLLGVREGGAPYPRSAADPEMFQRLLRPMGDVLIREDKRLSAALSANPLDAELHEQAALLVGSFALRHAAACFYDVRRELSAVTAHLAVARALDHNTGPAGVLAEAILSTLCGRERAALDILQQLDHNRDSKAGLPLEANTIWNRALTLRNTGDYRTLEQPEHASLFERLEYVRALHSRVSSEAATGFLLDHSAERMAEWTNVALSGRFSVGEGNRWAGKALKEEMEETVIHYRAYHDSRLDVQNAQAVAASLNSPAKLISETNADAPRMEVLGWGSWAQLHQRQVCELLYNAFYYLNDMAGLPESADKFKAEVTKNFSGLDLFPLVGMESEGRPDVENDKRASQLWQEKPEMVPFALSSGPKSRLTRAATRLSPILQPQTWFQPALPLGTLYDVAYRARPTLPGMDRNKLDQLKDLAPYEPYVLYHLMQKTWSQRPTAEQVAAQLETVAGYDTWAIETVASYLTKEPDRYEAVFTRLCQLTPNKYVDLGEYLSEHERPEAAARAYQKAIELAPDRVWVSNSMDWLVDYYYTHDRKDDAFAVAEMAADVYSAAGLETMARLCERADRLADAEKYLQKAAERYDNSGALLAFYTRHGSNAKYTAEAERLISKIFPHGKERVEIARLSGVPKAGIALTSSSKTCAAIGLQPGDVIVAINGIRIENTSQYFYQMDTSPTEKVDLIVFSRRNYRTIAANLPNHRLGGGIEVFRPADSR